MRPSSGAAVGTRWSARRSARGVGVGGITKGSPDGQNHHTNGARREESARSPGGRVHGGRAPPLNWRCEPIVFRGMNEVWSKTLRARYRDMVARSPGRRGD
ncbi:hypothetical protein GCM10023336_57760 [Streptomyces similanensis]|uniref:Uncharacterized protein n=1 Tax=Streptomyces similanensis TaxID=1274988 RepID=A0ABP9L5T6_9ACTN